MVRCYLLIDLVVILVDPLPVVVVSEERFASARIARQQRLFTMGNRWIRNEEGGLIVEHHPRSAGVLRKRQHVYDWMDASALPPNPEHLVAPMPPPPTSRIRLSAGM